MKIAKWAAALLAAAALTLISLWLIRPKRDYFPAFGGPEGLSPVAALFGADAKTKAPVLPIPSEAAPASAGARPAEAPLVLNAENFEAEVSECFRGRACELSEDPFAFYESLKRSSHPLAADRLISFLRKQLETSEGRTRFESAVREMIEDYYQGPEKTFQLAAYDDYRGADEEALALYRQLEKERQLHPGSVPPRWLNEANLLYKMHRGSEALPYYRRALGQLMANPDSEDQRDQLDFVQARIREIEGASANEISPPRNHP